MENKVHTFKPKYILSLPNGSAHTLTYSTNVGSFSRAVPLPLNLTSLEKLQYTSESTNAAHTTLQSGNIVVHTT